MIDALEIETTSHAATGIARTVSTTCINSSSCALLNEPSGPRGAVNGEA